MVVCMILRVSVEKKKAGKNESVDPVFLRWG